MKVFRVVFANCNTDWILKMLFTFSIFGWARERVLMEIFKNYIFRTKYIETVQFNSTNCGIHKLLKNGFGFLSDFENMGFYFLLRAT